jgi:hypothetical protein
MPKYQPSASPDYDQSLVHSLGESFTVMSLEGMAVGGLDRGRVVQKTARSIEIASAAQKFQFTPVLELTLRFGLHTLPKATLYRHDTTLRTLKDTGRKTPKSQWIFPSEESCDFTLCATRRLECHAHRTNHSGSGLLGSQARPQTFSPNEDRTLAAHNIDLCNGAEQWLLTKQ